MPTNVDQYFNETPDEGTEAIADIFSIAQQQLEELINDSAEKSAGMRKLLECRDCMYRAGKKED